MHLQLSTSKFTSVLMCQCPALGLFPCIAQEAATAVLQAAKRRSGEGNRRLFESFQRLTDQLIKYVVSSAVTLWHLFSSCSLALSRDTISSTLTHEVRCWAAALSSLTTSCHDEPAALFTHDLFALVAVGHVCLQRD